MKRFLRITFFISLLVLVIVTLSAVKHTFAAPDFSMLWVTNEFSPQEISTGGTTVLLINLELYTISEGNISFTNNLPSGLVVANPSNVTNSCGGSVTTSPGSNTLSLSNGSLIDYGSCLVTVNVVANSPGFKNNTTENISCGSSCLVLPVLPASMFVNPAGASGCFETKATNMPTQFDRLQNFGDPLAFRVGVGGTDYGIIDEMPCKHYQGIARGSDAQGTPYFFVTRSRNKTGSCNTWGCEPGELLIVRMGSRPGDGERLRSNRLKWDKDFGDTAPPESDIAEKMIRFDGSSFSYLGKIYHWPYNWHPGGVQLVDNVLVIPLECGDACDDSLCDDNGILLVDVSDPENPLPFYHETFPTLSQGLGVVAVAKAVDPDDGMEKYLFAMTWGDDTTMRFAWSDTNNLRTTTSIDLEPYTWSIGNLDYECTSCTWREWQVFNFVRGTNDILYLLTGDNDTTTVTDGDDYIGLVRVETSKLNDSQYGDALVYVRERHISVNDAEPDMGDLDAAGGFYVSPTGQLILYTADHRGFDKEGVMSVEMGEFTTIDIDSNGKCGLVWARDLNQVHVISPGEGVLLHGGSFFEPWVKLFEDTDYNFNTGSEESQVLTVDWRYNSNYREGGECDDYTCDEYHNFTSNGIDFFNDKMSSIAWCGVAGTTMTVYDNINFDTGGEGYMGCEGDGYIRRSTSISSFIPGGCTRSQSTGFNDKASGVEFLWSGSSGANSWSCLSCPGGTLSTSGMKTMAYFYATPGLPYSENTVRVSWGTSYKDVTIIVVPPIYLPIILR